MSTLRIQTLLKLLILSSTALFWYNAVAQSAQEDAQTLVAQAVKTVEAFTADEHMQDFRDHFKQARAVLIVPRSIKAGFIFGVSGGTGLMMARNEAGGWNGPAFYDVGGGSVGLQAGAQVSEIIILIMTDKGLESMLDTKFKFGGTAGVTIGVGAGAGKAVDIIGYARTKGAFGGLSLDGGAVEPRPELSSGFHGAELSNQAILIDGKGNSAAVAELRSALVKAAQ